MFDIRLIDDPRDLKAVEDLQSLIWPGDETEILPLHILRAAAHHGGIIIGAFSEARLVGFVFGFPGFEMHSGETILIHVSHMAGVHPEFRDQGLGFLLKRAQWQMVRYQGIDRITWTYDPLQSRNANLNISKLGAVCNKYSPNHYGKMRDTLNVGMPSDRFQVDWWVNSNRVRRRLRHPQPKKLDLAHYLSAGSKFVNNTLINERGLIVPEDIPQPSMDAPLLLLEIPPNISLIKKADHTLALRWNGHVRKLCLSLFSQGYIVTDFVYLAGQHSRSYYVFSHGEATL
jgi:predicted GNAT superfamily acetyltransferase